MWPSLLTPELDGKSQQLVSARSAPPGITWRKFNYWELHNRLSKFQVCITELQLNIDNYSLYKQQTRTKYTIECSPSSEGAHVLGTAKPIAIFTPQPAVSCCPGHHQEFWSSERDFVPCHLSPSMTFSYILKAKQTVLRFRRPHLFCGEGKRV